MRGRDYFTQDDERDWQHLYDRAVTHFQVRNSGGRIPRDFVANPITRDEYDTIYTNVVRENEYENWRARRDRELEGERVFWKGVDPLNVDALEEVSFDRPKLQPFKLKYDTIEEIRMRFHKTVILVKGQPFGVSDQRNIKDRFYLLLDDINSKKSYIAVEDIPDLRPAPPGYVRMNETNGYFKRAPARVNQQGMTSQSVVIKRVGSKDHLSFNTPSLVEALSSRGKNLPWDNVYRRLIDDRIVSSFRLSDNIALYKRPNFDPVVVEYKGRRLGELHDHSVKLFDEDDSIQPWLKSDAKKVDLEIMS